MMLYVVRCRRAGFTLIEIMIVIAIIAILAGIAVPNIMRARFEAQVTACQENCRMILGAVDMLRIRHSNTEAVKLLGGWSDAKPEYGDYLMSYITKESGLLEHGYLSQPLPCPTTGQFEYWFHSFGAWAKVRGTDCFVYRDYNYSQRVQMGTIKIVACAGLHGQYGKAYPTVWCVPAHEETVGPCFANWNGGAELRYAN